VETLVILVLALLAVPVIALVLAIWALSRLGELQRKLERLEGHLRQRDQTPVHPAPPTPHVPPAAEPEPPSAAEPPPPSVEAPLSSHLLDLRKKAEQPEVPTGVAEPAPPISVADVSPETSKPEPAPARPRLEELLGTRLFVWIGALAIFLAGALFVKFAIDLGMLTPTVRVVLLTALGAVLLVLGEWWRVRYARIAQGVTAAGVACLFAAFLAAVNPWHLIPREVGFALLAANTALAVGLSLRQGPFVALLGLIGGFATPALIGSEEPQPGVLFTYLFLLQAGLLTVTRRRQWWPLGWLTQVAALGWVALWLFTNYVPADSVWIGPFLIAGVVVFVAATFQRPSPNRAGTQNNETIAILGAIAGLVMLAVLVGAGGFATMDWVFLGLLGAGAMVLARLDARYEPLAWIAPAASAALLIAWGLKLPPADTVRFGQTALALGVLYAGGAYAASWGARLAAAWASVSVALALAYLLISYGCLEYLPARPAGLRWGAICLILAAIYAVGSVPIFLRRARVAGSEMTLAALLTGVTCFVSLAMPIELEKHWIGVAWALEVPALALMGGWLRVPALRTLAGGLAILATGWLCQPGVLWYPLGTNPVFDWIVYAYIVSAVAFAVAAWSYQRQGVLVLADALRAGVVLMVLALLTLKVRRYFHPEALHELEYSLRECAAYTSAWLLLAAGAAFWARRAGQYWLPLAGNIVFAGAALLVLGVLALANNPTWNHDSIGARHIINDLLLIYGLPALLMLPPAFLFARRGERDAARVAGGLALGLIFLLVTLEVRQWFRGEFLDGSGATLAESYAYSAAWIALGITLLAGGIATRGLVLRWGSLIVMLLSVGKVFLFDTAHLRDLYRVFSLLGLGVSLLLLAFLYQRFVFRREAPTPPPET
jgi:uncharacterized membrane protein